MDALNDEEFGKLDIQVVTNHDSDDMKWVASRYLNRLGVLNTTELYHAKISKDKASLG